MKLRIYAAIVLAVMTAFAGCNMDDNNGKPAITVDSISAIYTQTVTVYPNTPLNDLKSELIVTSHYSNGTTEIVAASAYSLSGTLTIPTSTITVTYRDTFTSFSVTVSSGSYVPIPSSVSIIPNSATVTIGKTQHFIATVTGMENVAVIWTVSGSNGSSNINAAGLLTVGASEANNRTLIVTATSVADASKSTSATVMVNNKANAQTPVIITHPKSASFTIGTAVTLSVTTGSITDGGTLSYMWYRNTIGDNTGGTLVDDRNASYTPPVNTGGIFHYYVVVTNTIPDNEDGGVKMASTASYVATLTAQYTVSFNSNGGTAIAPITTNHNSIITAPAIPTRTGFGFDGWYTDASFNIPAMFPITITAAMTLYAKWNINQYTVSFNSNGGTAVASITASYSSTITAPASPTRVDGFVFAGWYKEAALTNVWDFVTNTVTTDITLYAKWFPPYTVTFDSDGGSYVAPIVNISHGSTITAPVPPTKIPATEGLYAGTPGSYRSTFTGWFAPGVTTAFSFNTPITADITLTARWTDPRVNLSGTTGTTIVDRAFNYVNANPGTYTLQMDSDVSIAGNNSRSLNQSNAKLTIIGLNAKRKIRLNSSGRMFTVGTSGQTGIELTIGDNITLEGLLNNSSNEVVYVQNNAAFIMQGNSAITGNYGGGVQVRGGSNFIMQDYASVFGNTGDGVWVVVDSTFTMKDSASVIGNTSSGSWGGVGVSVTSGTFTMQGGTVSGNTVSGVWVDNGTFTVSATASIDDVRLRAQSYTTGNLPITIASGWTGSIANLDLSYDTYTISTVISWWVNKPVLIAAAGYTLTTTDVERVTLRNFWSSSTTQAISPTHYISTDSGNIGVLVER